MEKQEKELSFPDPKSLKTVTIAHDYVRFGDGTTDITFGIRAFQQVIWPLLVKSKYVIDPEHLVYKNDKKEIIQNYLNHTEPIIYQEPETNRRMVAIRLEDEAGYSHLTLRLYNQLFNKSIAQ